MEPSDRIALPQNIVARYDGYYHLAAMKASLLLTTNVLLLGALGSGETGMPDLWRASTASAVSVGASALLSLLSMLLAGTAIASHLEFLCSAVPPSVILSTAVAGQLLEAYKARLGGGSCAS